MSERISAWTGGIAGAAAYVVGYIMTYAWKSGDYRDVLDNINPIMEFLGSQAPETWRIIGWLFYSAHYVDTSIDLGVEQFYVNLVQSGGGNLELLYLIPPALLVVAGFAVARNFQHERVIDAATKGAWVALGYLPLVAFGAILFQIDGSGPDLIPSILIAGVVYPVIFGAVGGVLARGTQ